VTGFPRQTDQRPKVSQAGRDTFPEQTQAVVVFHRLGEAQDITVNQLDPMLNCGWLGRATTLVHTRSKNNPVHAVTGNPSAVRSCRAAGFLLAFHPPSCAPG